MNAKTLRRKGQEVLFRENLGAYQREVETLIGATKAHKDLGDPQVVMDCLTVLTDLADELTDTWWTAMRQARSDNDYPDPEPSEDSGNVGLNTLAEGELYDRLGRATLKFIELFVSE